MNWFTKRAVSAQTAEIKKSLVEQWGGCEHVEADSTLLFSVSYENDSFGGEGHCFCKECSEKAYEETQAELVTCHDCKKDFPRSETIEWKWYDFYAASGDEALCICNSCRKLPTHVNRVRRDHQDYLSEFPED